MGDHSRCRPKVWWLRGPPKKALPWRLKLSPRESKISRCDWPIGVDLFSLRTVPRLFFSEPVSLRPICRATTTRKVVGHLFGTIDDFDLPTSEYSSPNVPTHQHQRQSLCEPAKMSDNGEIEVETANYQVLPKDVTAEVGSIKLFNRWSYEDVEIRDISLT